MTNTVNDFLQKLSAKELHELFLKESDTFLILLNQHPNSEELERVKQRIKMIMDALDEKRSRRG